MKPIDYIYKNLDSFNISIFKQIVEESGEEVSESIYDYLMETTWNTNPALLRQFGLDIERSSEEQNIIYFIKKTPSEYSTVSADVNVKYNGITYTGTFDIAPDTETGGDKLILWFNEELSDLSEQICGEIERAISPDGDYEKLFEIIDNNGYLVF